MKLLYMPHKNNFLYWKCYYSYKKISGFKGNIYDFILIQIWCASLTATDVVLFYISFLIDCKFDCGNTRPCPVRLAWVHMFASQKGGGTDH